VGDVGGEFFFPNGLSPFPLISQWKYHVSFTSTNNHKKLEKKGEAT
jgi:hypothetical protein